MIVYYFRVAKNPSYDGSVQVQAGRCEAWLDWKNTRIGVWDNVEQKGGHELFLGDRYVSALNEAKGKVKKLSGSSTQDREWEVGLKYEPGRFVGKVTGNYWTKRS